MDLILWRHAEAGEPRETSDELERGLTAKGERQAHRVAEWLGRHLPASAKVLVSPARCAQQTAAALDRKFKTLPELAPSGHVEQLLHAARWPDGRDCVVVVGHQPALGMTAAYLLALRTDSWILRKGGLLWLRSREREGQQQIILHAAMGPELV